MKKKNRKSPAARVYDGQNRFFLVFVLRNIFSDVERKKKKEDNINELITVAGISAEQYFSIFLDRVYTAKLNTNRCAVPASLILCTGTIIINNSRLLYGSRHHHGNNNTNNRYNDIIL